MPEPTSCAGCCVRTGTYCDRCDLLVGLPGLHVIKVVEGADSLTVTVESPPAPAGCPVCGVIATSGGRRTVVLVDAPCFGRPVRVLWRKRTWRCRESCLFRQIVHRARRADLPAAGLVDDPSVLVGDRTAPGRACLGPRSGSAARDDVDSVAQHPAAAGAAG